MNHPDLTAWITWLYGEVSQKTRLELEAHLATCPACRERIERWRQTMIVLDSAGIPRRPARRSFPWAPLARWSAAAAILIGLGIVLGRQSAVTATELEREVLEMAEAVRADLGAQQRAQLWEASVRTANALQTEHRVAVDKLAQQVMDARVRDHAEWLELWRRMDYRYASSLAELREGLHQLAAHTGLGFEETQNQVRLLAATLAADLQFPTPLQDEFKNPKTNQMP
jgi:hypothetical protein